MGSGRVLTELGGGGIPVPPILMVVVFIALSIVLRRTRFGRFVYAVGGNPEASRLIGLPVERVQMILYVISGISGAVAGTMLAAQLGAAAPNAASTHLLTVIAAIILGGTSLYGGRGSVWGTLLAVLILGTLGNGLTLMDVSSFWQDVTRGVVLMLAVSLDHAKQMYALAKEHHIQLLTNYETTWYGSNAMAIEVLKGLGPITKMVVHDGHQGPKEIGVNQEFLDWLTDPVMNGGGALVDFGLHFFHTARQLLENGQGPYYYLPKMESHLEARLWNEVFVFAQDYLGIPQGTIRATVLIETIPAAFEMDEILYELRDHASGLNAGRWDYLFSIIKYFRDAGPRFVLPDRATVAMTAPFMRAYTELLVKTCHHRGAFAMGGMAAVIPNRREPEVTAQAFEKVRADKTREANDGFDGSWVAHPDLVPVCRDVFDAVLGERPNQLDRQRPEVSVTPDQLLDIASANGTVTEAGLRLNLYVAVAYTAVWISGNGAVAIHNLMEDAATAEISRSQVWQQIRNQVVLADTGRTVTRELVAGILAEETEKLRGEVGEDAFAKHYLPASKLIGDICLSEDYTDFLTTPAYELVD
ncbi:hypothetical protein [uncultured Arthrobacter sp.]|uniref:ABC transporter permease subunit n=1 Tax=uncultured Arthrobacter sp. TaxID=114050 RepID=UPI003216782C